METANKHVYLVDDDPALRRTVRRMLDPLGAGVEEFDSAETFLARLEDLAPGCILLDMRLPGLNGLDLLDRIAASNRLFRVIMLSGYGDIPSAVQAVKMGAMDFIQKPFDRQRLVEVVRRALESLSEAAERREDFTSLTQREREVLEAFSSGAPNKIVAYELGLSPRTVEMHRARIFKKLGVTNLSQALLRARDAGLKLEQQVPDDD